MFIKSLRLWVLCILLEREISIFALRVWEILDRSMKTLVLFLRLKRFSPLPQSLCFLICDVFLWWSSYITYSGRLLGNSAVTLIVWWCPSTIIGIKAMVNKMTTMKFQMKNFDGKNNVENPGNCIAREGGHSQDPAWCWEEFVQDGGWRVDGSRCSSQGHYYTMLIWWSSLQYNEQENNCMFMV